MAYGLRMESRYPLAIVSMLDTVGLPRFPGSCDVLVRICSCMFPGKFFVRFYKNLYIYMVVGSNLRSC